MPFPTAKFAVLVTIAAALPSAMAQGATCNATTPCPASAPCCSEFGFCGEGTFCLGGCNPLWSHALDSCKPEPVCQSSTMTFNDLSRIQTNATYYNGNATGYDWVVDKGSVQQGNGEIDMILTEENGGTRLSSTRYVHYGTISAQLKTGKWGGVVTAFITMSDVKDEIDWEFPGDSVTQGQTNYFWQGFIPDPTNGGFAKDLSSTFDNYHTYTIDWQPDTLNFGVDGNTVRTVKKSDTIDDKGVAHYPSTPSRVQLSIWPAGINSSAQGTVEWSGGLIDWNSPDYKSAGHFWATVKSVEIKCADPQTPGNTTTGYMYGANSSALTPAVSFSNVSTLLNGQGALAAPPAIGIFILATLAVALGALAQTL